LEYFGVINSLFGVRKLIKRNGRTVETVIPARDKWRFLMWNIQFVHGHNFWCGNAPTADILYLVKTLICKVEFNICLPKLGFSLSVKHSLSTADPGVQNLQGWYLKFN